METTSYEILRLAAFNDGQQVRYIHNPSREGSNDT